MNAWYLDWTLTEVGRNGLTYSHNDCGNEWTVNDPEDLNIKVRCLDCEATLANDTEII